MSLLLMNQMPGSGLSTFSGVSTLKRPGFGSRDTGVVAGAAVTGVERAAALAYAACCPSVGGVAVGRTLSAIAFSASRSFTCDCRISVRPGAYFTCFSPVTAAGAAALETFASGEAGLRIAAGAAALLTGVAMGAAGVTAETAGAAAETAGAVTGTAGAAGDTGDGMVDPGAAARGTVVCGGGVAGAGCMTRWPSVLDGAVPACAVA